MAEPNLAKRARQGTGLSQRAFAQLLGTYQPNVAKWETGVVVPSSLAVSLLRLVEAFPADAVRVLAGALEEQGAKLDKLADALSELGQRPKGRLRALAGKKKAKKKTAGKKEAKAKKRPRKKNGRKKRRGS